MTRPRPALQNLVATRPSARDVSFGRGDPIWYRRTPEVLVPGVFDRYGAVRVAVVIVTPFGRHDVTFVDPRNVYARLDRDEVTP